jgi:succinoglycan biosynthesis transport protein ExoP
MERIPSAHSYNAQQLADVGQADPPYMGQVGPQFWHQPVHQEEANIFSRLWRRKGWFLSTTSLVACITVGAYIVYPRTYRAEGQVEIQASNIEAVVDPSSVQPQVDNNVGDTADIETQILKLSSPQLMHYILNSNPAIADAIMQECVEKKTGILSLLKAHIHKSKTCEQALATDDQRVSWLAGGFSIEPAGRSRILSVDYTSPDPSVAKLMVNTLMGAYLAEGIANKLGPRTTASEWLEKRIDTLRNEIDSGEKDIVAYSKAHGLMNGQNGPIQNEDLSSLSQERYAAEARRAQDLAALTQSKHGVGSMQGTTNSATVSALRAQESQDRSYYDRLAAVDGASNPNLIAARKALGAVEGELGGEVGRVGTGLRQAYLADNQDVMDLDQQINQLKIQVSTASDAESQIASMKQDVAIERGLYATMQTKADQLQTDRRLVAGDENIVSEAYTPDSPWTPKLTPFALGGLIASLAFGFLAATIRDKADKSVRATSGLEAATQIPVIGHIPSVSYYKQKQISGKRNIAVTTHPQLDKPSALQESIRSLYAKCSRNKDRKTIMVTSSNPGDGKTFLALALAQFAAKTEKKVLIIEADMRKPTFAERLQTHGKVGLVDYLRNDKVSFDDAIQKTAIPYLDVITAGRVAIDSTELLMNGKLASLLAAAKAAYDFVLIDSPPERKMMDACIMAPMVDSILYCARWGSTDNDSVAAGIKQLKLEKGNVIGIVLGKVKSGEYTMYESRSVRGITGPYLLEGRS